MESRRDYVRAMGSVRKLAGKAILDLSKDEIRELDLQLIERAKSTRTILKMFLRDNERFESGGLILPEFSGVFRDSSDTLKERQRTLNAGSPLNSSASLGRRMAADWNSFSPSLFYGRRVKT